jgi:hypothetical protein
MDPSVWVEYPETHAEWLGYKFKEDPSSWRNRASDVVYSLESGGQTAQAKPQLCPLLVSEITGEPVPCIVYHSTCMFMDKILLISVF